MKYESKQFEEQMVLETAKRMCVAARTAPKARGRDNIVTLILTGAEKEALAVKMEEVVARDFGGDPGHFYIRDSKNVRQAAAVVLIGVKRFYAGLKNCSFCGFADCAACEKAGGRCAFNTLDMGIALGSAASLAADDRVDSRIMFSVGRVAMELDFTEEGVLWHGIPLSVTSKSPFFDR